MIRHTKSLRLTAFLIALAVMVCSFPVVYSEDVDVTETAAEAVVEVTAPEPEPESAPEPEPMPEPVSEPEPAPAPEPEPEPIPEPAPAPEPEPAPASAPEPEPDPEPAPAPEPENTVVTELEHDDDAFVEEQAAFDDDGDDTDEFDGDEELVEFEEWDAGMVSDDLLQQFNNPDSYTTVEFTGSADIRLENPDTMFTDGWDGVVTLTAEVRDASLSYRLVWEANDHDDRGWFTVGSGDEYSYTMTRDIAEREANREYRVVMFTVD